MAVTVFFSLVSSSYSFLAAVMGSLQLAWVPAAGMHGFPAAGMGSLQLVWVSGSWDKIPAADMGSWQLSWVPCS